MLEQPPRWSCTSSLALSKDDATRIDRPILLNPDGAQTRAVQKGVPLRSGALAGAEERQHLQIKARGPHVRPRLGQHDLVDQNLRAGRERRDDGGEDLHRLLVAPVVQDRAQVVVLGSYFEAWSASRSETVGISPTNV